MLKSRFSRIQSRSAEKSQIYVAREAIARVNIYAG